MSIYRFGNNSLIDEVTIHHSQGGGVRAYLHARDGAGKPELDALKKTLTDHPLQWTPILEDGKPLLEVRGFGKHEEDLLSLLGQDKAVIGGYSKQHTVDDTLSLKDKAKSNTLKLSGYSYFVGDAGFLYYSAKEALKGKKIDKPLALAAGIFYAAGSPFLVFFGRGDKSDIQLKHMSYNLIHELKHKGIEVPEDSAAHAVANGHNATRWKKIKSFCERYPAEIANGLFGVAGASIMWEKYKDFKTFDLTPLKNLKGKGWKEAMAFLKEEQHIPGQTAHSPKSVVIDFALGAATVMAGLISVFVEEEVPDPSKKKETGIMGILQKIKHRPLAAASAALAIATIGHGSSTWIDYKKLKGKMATLEPLSEADRNLQKGLYGRGLFTITNLTAEGLMAVSSKGHGSGVKSDASLERSAYAVSADFINRLPEEQQPQMLHDIAQLLAQKKHLSGDPAKVEAGIREQLANIKINPWASGPVSNTEPQKEVEEETKWRGKYNAAQLNAAAVSPALG